jgi:DNA end-binding protein Ku
MVLETLRYADEVHRASSYFREIGDSKPDPDLLDMASTLIERKAGEFDPKDFHNRYVDALHELIEKKAGEFDPKDFHNRYVDALHELIAKKQKSKGKKIIEQPDEAPPKGSNVIDLMAALKKSLGDEKKAKKAPAKTAKREAPARKRA